MNKQQQLLKEDQMIKSYIKRLVRESLETMAANYQYEEDNSGDNSQEKDDNSSEELHRIRF